jgi:hypothetical protein
MLMLLGGMLKLKLLFFNMFYSSSIFILIYKLYAFCMYGINIFPHKGWHVWNFELALLFIASGVGLSPSYCGHYWPIVPAPDDRWAWLWSNWWNEIPLDQTRDRTRAAAVGSHRLTAWAMARPELAHRLLCKHVNKHRIDWAWDVSARSNIGIVGSGLPRGMDSWAYSMFMLPYVRRDFGTSWFHI